MSYGLGANNHLNPSLGPDYGHVLDMSHPDIFPLAHLFGGINKMGFMNSQSKKVPFETITEMFSGPSKRVITQINQKVMTTDSWHFLAFTRRETDDLRPLEIQTINFKPHIPERRAPLTVSPIVSHMSDKRKSFFYNYGLSTFMEVDALKTPSGQEILDHSLEQIRGGIILQMQIATHYAISKARNTYLLRQMVEGSYNSVYKRAQEWIKYHGIINRYDKATIDLFAYLEEIFSRAQLSFSFVVIPLPVKKMFINEYNTEYWRSGIKALEVVEKLSGAFNQIYGYAVFSEDVKQFDGGSINDEVQPMKTPYMVGEYFTSDNNCLETCCGSKYMEYCSKLRDIAFLNFEKGNVEWDVFTLKQLIQNCVAFDNNDPYLQFDYANYEDLIMRWPHIADAAKMKYRRNDIDQPMVDPFLYFPLKQTTPKLTEFLGEQDPSYTSESFYRDASEIVKERISSMLDGDKTISFHINRLLQYCDQAYRRSLFDRSDPNGVHEPLALAYALKDQPFNEFGVKELPPVANNVIRYYDSFNNMLVDLTFDGYEPDSGTEDQTTNTTVMPSGYSTIAHMYTLQKHFLTSTYPFGWSNDSFKELCKNINESLDQYEKLADLLIEMFDNSKDPKMKNVFLRREMLPQHIEENFTGKKIEYFLIFQNLLQEPHYYLYAMSGQINNDVSSHFGEFQTIGKDIVNNTNDSNGKGIDIRIIAANMFFTSLNKTDTAFSRDIATGLQNFKENYENLEDNGNIDFDDLVYKLNTLIANVNNQSDSDNVVALLRDLVENTESMFADTIDDDFLNKRRVLKGDKKIVQNIDPVNNEDYDNTGLSFDFTLLSKESEQTLDSVFGESGFIPQDPRTLGVFSSFDPGNPLAAGKSKDIKKYGRGRYKTSKNIVHKVNTKKLSTYGIVSLFTNKNKENISLNPYIRGKFRDSPHMNQRLIKINKHMTTNNNIIRAIHLLYLGTYVCGKQMINFANMNIPVPMSFFVVRPFIELTMYAMYCLNPNIGVIEYGFEDNIVNFNGKIKGASVDTSFFMTSYVLSDQTNFVQPNIAHCEYLRGAGRTFITDFKTTDIMNRHSPDLDLTSRNSFNNRVGDNIVLYGGGSQDNNDLGDESIFDLIGPFFENGLLNANYNEYTRDMMKQATYPCAAFFITKTNIHQLNLRNRYNQNSFHEYQRISKVNINTLVYKARQNAYDPKRCSYSRNVTDGCGVFRRWKPDTGDLISGKKCKTLELIKDNQTSLPRF